MRRKEEWLWVTPGVWNRGYCCHHLYTHFGSLQGALVFPFLLLSFFLPSSNQPHTTPLTIPSFYFSFIYFLSGPFLTSPSVLYLTCWLWRHHEPSHLRSLRAHLPQPPIHGLPSFGFTFVSASSYFSSLFNRNDYFLIF